MAQGVGRVTSDGWRQAEIGYTLQFPRDHGSHPDYRIEWWYYTGNLSSDDGRRFGYQVTFFRIGVDPAPDNPSRWAVRDLFMAHLALTDIGAGRQRMAERLDPGRCRVGRGPRRDTRGLERRLARRTRRHDPSATGGRRGVRCRSASGARQGADGPRRGWLSRKGAQAGNAPTTTR